MSAPAITSCPHCLTRILPVTGVCPACGKLLDAPRQPPAKMPPKPSIHPLLYGICLVLIAGSMFAWYGTPPNTGLEPIIWILGVMWLGTLGIIILTAKRAVLMRRWKSQQARQNRA